MTKTKAPKGAHSWAVTMVAAGLLGVSSSNGALVTTLNDQIIGTTQFRGYAPFLEMYTMREVTITNVSWLFDPRGQASDITVSLVDLRDGTVMGNLTSQVVDSMTTQSFIVEEPGGMTIPAGTPFAILMNGHGAADFPQVETPQSDGDLAYFGTRAFYVESVPGQTLRDFNGSASFSVEGTDLSGFGDTSPIPEPSCTLLIAGGFLLFGWRRRRS